MRTLYDVLGVEPAADARAIRSAFIALAKAHHPDANPADATAARRFREISTAREILKDPESRADYDAFLENERRRSRRRLLRSASAYSVVFVATFCAVFAARERLSPPPEVSVAATSARPVTQSPELAFAQASEAILRAVVAQGTPDPAPPSPAPIQDSSRSLHSQEHQIASERPTSPIDPVGNEPPTKDVDEPPGRGIATVLDTVANEPPGQAVDEPPRGATATVPDESAGRPIDIAANEPPATALDEPAREATATDLDESRGGPIDIATNEPRTAADEPPREAAATVLDESSTGPIETAANEPRVTAVDEPPRGGIAGHVDELADRPVETAANQPSAADVDDPPRPATATALDQSPDKRIDTARHDADLPTGSIPSKARVAMREVRVSASYRDRKGVWRHVVRVFEVQHEDPDP